MTSQPSDTPQNPSEAYLAHPPTRIINRKVTPPVDTGYDLSLLLPSDAQELTNVLQDPIIHANTSSMPFPYTISHAHYFINYCMEIGRKCLEMNYPPLNYCIRERATGKFVGSIGIHDLNIPTVKAGVDSSGSGGHRGVMGYYLSREVRGKGLMPLAVKEVALIMFSEPWNLYRIDGETFIGNEQSQRVLLKCGFQREGVTRGALRKRADGLVYDAVMHGLLKPEFVYP
ncbi:hypothetical protein HDU97_005196 [Phlyctochytrium planicorne]|nr:hypothetical protein HDU97_005196 [Phlyctochytrium planicorne]